MTTTTDDDDVTRIQPAAVRAFNEQIARAYMRPQDYDRYGAANERLLLTGTGDHVRVDADPTPLPPETTTPLPDDPLPVPPGASGSSTPGTPPAPTLSPAGARPRRARKRGRIWPWFLALVGTLMLGIWAGSGTNPVQPVGTPVAAVTVTAEPQPEIRAVTPKACIDALRAADQAFDIVFNALGDIGEGDKMTAKAAKREYRRQLEPVGRTYWVKRDICYTSR